MAVPGFSVSDLIQALGQVKLVYDAFFNEYTNTAAQVRDLADDIEQFRANLQKHKEIVEQGGLEYTGYESVKRTLNSCYRFLDDYKDILDKKRRKSVVGAFKTARFAFEQEEVSRLRGQIAGHKSDILHYSMNVVLEHSIRGKERIGPFPNSASNPIPIPGQSPHQASSPPTPPQLGSAPLNQGNCASRTPGSPSGSSSQPRFISVVDNRAPTPISSPQIPPTSESPNTVRSPSSYNGSPPLRSTPATPQSGLSIPGLVLPQPALPYRVAEVYFENKKVDLKRKAAGRDCASGREMVIVDEAGKLRFRHRIKSPRNEPCYPYTWHRRWRNDHDALEIGFKGTAPEAHSISFKEMPAISAIPKYIFSKVEDFEDFQSELRGKHLEATFEARQIMHASSSRNGEATDQHLKIWKDYSTHEFSISFYASAIPKPRHVEFPLAMFEQQTSSSGDFEVCINFVRHEEPKKARNFSKSFSRSPTERTTSSASTTVQGIFTRHNTGVASSASSITTTSNSRMSGASFQSDSVNSQAEGSKTGDPLEIQAKTMKYLRIEFSDDEETSRFKKIYARAYQEEITKPFDFVLNWKLAANQQTADSVISVSPSVTPLTMSPVLNPIRNQTSNTERLT